MPRFLLPGLTLLLAACGTAPAQAPTGTALGSWSHYGGDAGGERHSPVDQIDRSNVSRLELAWSVRTGDLDAEEPPPAHMAFQATPILVGEHLVLPTPLGRVIALDPETGEERWRFVTTVPGHRYPEYTSRGVASWRDPVRAEGEPCAVRIFAATVASRLFALDAATGTPCADFGSAGEVNLREGVGALGPWDYSTSSPPVVAGEVLVIGSAIGDNQRVDAPRGVVRAYHPRTGALAWAWDPVPRSASDPAHAGWDAKAAQRTGAANAWAPLSYDAERDLLFVPTSSPSPDYYGGKRPGDNRYANSIVALRARSGEVAWHFQTVHHDLWDYDVPAQPTLTSLPLGGDSIPVVVQPTKLGHLFVLHRDTGEPVYPVEERPVAASDVPGEIASPTQPHPTWPEPYVPQRLTAAEAWGLTPWDRGRCRERIEALRNEGLFTPPSLQGSLVYPGHAGGSNWGGISVDPQRRLVIANATNLAVSVRLIPREHFEEESADPALLQEFAPQAGTPYGMVREFLRSPLGLPCTPPPWGVLAALSLDTGKVVWSRAFGTAPDLIPFPVPIEPGLPNLGGSIVTAGGLVFIGASMDGRARAFDVETGEELWSVRPPAAPNATPMTYRLAPDRRQFVVFAAGGHGKLGTRRGDSVVAYALPE